MKAHAKRILNGGNRGWRPLLSAAQKPGYALHISAMEEPVHLVGRADKIRGILGWKPSGTFCDLVQEMVETELKAIDSE